MNIDAKLVKKLRDMTGAGMMDCKKALVKTGGDIDKAIEHLRKTGAAKAAKKLDRAANEGQVISYIHPGGKLGVLVELNCETDFVARTPEFQALGKDIAMQIAATDPISVSIEELPQDIVEKEKEIYIEQALSSGKPKTIAERIADGKLKKFYESACLLEQEFIKDSSRKVKDIIMELIAKVGENIRVSRFARFKIGE
ncbi:translation elongation factor Ts [bacterium]|nr:translation elongation factor Ts [bacterium]